MVRTTTGHGGAAGDGPADPAGDLGAGVPVAGHRPHGGAQRPAAVQRQAGQGVEHRHDDVAHRELEGELVGQGAGGQRPGDGDGRRPEQRGDRRAGQRHQQVDLGAGRVAVHLGVTAEQLQGDSPHTDAVAAGGEGVPELVQQHRAEQRHDEPEADQVAADLGELELAAGELGVHDGDEDGEQQHRRVEVQGHPEDPTDGEPRRAAVVAAAARSAAVPSPRCYRDAGQCSGLQAGGEGPCCAGRQGPSSALDRAVLLLDVLTHGAQRCPADGAREVRA